MTAGTARWLTVAMLVVFGAPSTGWAQQVWDYTALGDSLATGYLAQAGYVPRYQAVLETDNSVSVTLYNLGQNGWTSGGLFNALETNATFQTAVSQAIVVTWDIGMNDFRNARA